MKWLTDLFISGAEPSPRPHADLALFHEFTPPPSGGGHQFMRALENEFKRRGLRIENNQLSPDTPVCLFNSYNFDFKKLKRQHHRRCRMVHRVDGPLATYRGTDDGTDRRIQAINRKLADATIFQSHYSLGKHQELGLSFTKPVVIPNATDPDLFSATGRPPFDLHRKTRLISVSWSDNLNKGATVYQWLDDHLDWSRYEYTFIGRSPIVFRKIRMLAPLTSSELASELRAHDIYITASRNDPCSNSLLEALSCGLPSLYLNSGGHPEITGQGGVPFEEPPEIPGLLEDVIARYSQYQSLISVPGIGDVATQYLKVLGIHAGI